MARRRSFFATICLTSILLLSKVLMFADGESSSAAQVIDKYMEAIGADRFSSITTFAEHGELYGNLTSREREHAISEFYFKSPNLRFRSIVTAKNRIIGLGGCDGRIAWYIDSQLKRTEFTPKPGKEFECAKGYEPMPSPLLRDPQTKTKLAKKKEVEGRVAWEVIVDAQKLRVHATYYFDVETYLLLRVESTGSRITYSDYRDVGGFKFPFKTRSEMESSTVETTIRELVINGPIDDARFIERTVKDGVVTLGSPASLKGADAGTANVESNATTPTTENGKSKIAAEIPPAPKAASVTEINFPNFILCTIPELQLAVPELKGLKAVPSQEQVSALLGKVGAKTVETARNTPNLISHETVTALQQGAAVTRYDYLILNRIEGNSVYLDEFRVDLKTGDKFDAEETIKNAVSTRAAVERASHDFAASQSGRQPISQGFAASWVYFYPLNQQQSTFRYLGEQKMDGHRTLVLAFAQKPGSVNSPARFIDQGKIVPMFLQGVAWVDASDFHIWRLRTDLLSPLPEVSLHRLTAEIQFEPTRIAEVSSLLSLPREVKVTSEVGGSTREETHKYAEYRLFRARSRMVLNP